jgi:glyoxylase-like metal-dependent hydrolase (beta-lactamase superfamily II)
VTVALTHGHSDHTGAAGQFDRVFAHKNEWAEIRDNPGGGAVVLRELNDGDSFDLGGCLIRVCLTAGHTQGSLSFLDVGDRILFAGDNVSDRTVYMCLPGADITQYRATLNWILDSASQFDTILGCHGTAQQSLDQVHRLLACLDACEAGRTEDERVTVYSGDTALKRTYHGASIYTPCAPV